MKLMRGGRARWKIENETFNTLKNQGYHFEHNFGHGYKHLTTVLMHLMMLAFLIDQIQQLCCPMFRAALTTAQRKIYLWRKLRSRFDLCRIASWEALYHPSSQGCSVLLAKARNYAVRLGVSRKKRPLPAWRPALPGRTEQPCPSSVH
uniref:Transposase DDE domain-containing protein n=1 Tax=Candidatus Kentrum sp. FM TaxID=2126340 RepID=A0A450T3G6_9GAMM|nr:MAG: hypothetical protein BECKFM1743A_GA0114220_102792 [Candidatus Kentron sp. FM]